MNAFILFILVISNVVGLIDAYSESRWKAISLNLPASSNHPQRRRSSSFHYCDGLDRALLYGGFYNPDGVDDAADYPDASMILSDAWLYSFPPLSQWTRIYPQTSEPALPKARAEHASTVLPSSFISASDTSYCHVVIHGGLTANPDIASDPKSYLDDLWILSVSISSSSPNNDGNNSSSVNGLHTFTKPIEDSTGSPKPSTRAGHGLLVVGNFLYLIGGYTTKFGVTTIQNTMHKLQLTGSKQSNGKGYSFKAKWQEIPFANGKDGPEFRARATFASDPSTNTIVMFGGERGAGQILSDVWIFDTVSEKWTKIMGYEVRNTLSAAVMYESNFVWYAGSYREVSGSITRTYVYRDSGLGAVAVRTKGTGEREISFKCIDPSSKAEAMWCISGYDELSSPGARFGHSMIIRNGEMILFGGEFINSFSDMWSVSLPNVIALGKVYVPSTSQSTIYFAMATLTLLLFGFMVFVANARRRSIAYRNALAMHSRGPPVPPPPIGVPSNMITLLPTFSYTKGIKPDVSSLFAAIEKEYSKSQDKSNESGSFEKVIPQSSSSISPLPSESKELDINSSIAADVCPICLAEFEEKESLKVLPCSHFFHPSCIDEWLNGHNSCPMCKRYVVCDVRTNETQPIQDPQAQQQQQQQQQSTSIEMGTIQREFSIDVSTTPPQQQQEERQTNNNSTASNTDTAATNSSGGITSIHATSNNPTSFVSHV